MANHVLFVRNFSEFPKSQWRVVTPGSIRLGVATERQLFRLCRGKSSDFKTPPRPNLSSPMSLHSGGILLVAMEDRLDRQSDRATLMGQDEQHGHGNEKGVQILTDDGDFSLLEPASKGFPPRPFDRPLPCFGCGVGWFSFLLGFAFPPFWYYATVLYFGNYHHKDPRERAGLAASAIAALISTVAILISLLAVFFPRTFQRH